MLWVRIAEVIMIVWGTYFIIRTIEEIGEIEKWMR